MKKALITGISGQDGSYLSGFLLDKGYEVSGMIRRKSEYQMLHNEDKLNLYYGDMTDASSLDKVVRGSDPDEIYNLAAQSHVGVSFKQPVYTVNVNGCGVARLLECVKSYNKEIKIYQASTSEMFGNCIDVVNESTPFYTKSPYAASKLFAHHICNIYRRSYDMFISCGILFNHESPRRGENFVTRKITKGLTRIKYGLQDKLLLGNINSKRDWGYAGDYIRAMWLILQHDVPDDFVIATGVVHSIKEFIIESCKKLSMNIKFIGHADEEKVLWRDDVIIEISKEFYRPDDVTYLRGDYSKAYEQLGWEPDISFKQLINIMIDMEINKIEIEGKRS